MNSIERVRAALTGKPADRVPIVEIVIDPKVASVLVPDMIDVPDAFDKLGLDNIGSSAVFDRVEQRGDEFVDEWGVTFRESMQVSAHPIAAPVKSKDDLAKWTPPDPDAPQRLSVLRDVVQRYKGRRAIMFHNRVAFMTSAYLVGLDRLLEMFYEDPDFAHEVLLACFAVNEKIVRGAIRAGADVITLGDDYASNQGPLFSPKMFREFVLPYLKRMVDIVHEEGAFAVKHSDGNIWPIIEDIVNTGLDGLNPLEPTAGMNLADVKAKYGSRLCLVGNIDCGELLSHGTTKQVEEAVVQAIRDGAPGGRYMLCSSNSIHASVNPLNYRTMIETGHKYGDYGRLGQP